MTTDPQGPNAIITCLIEESLHIECLFLLKHKIDGLTQLMRKDSQGLVHVGENSKTENDRETLGTRIIQMAIDFSVRHDLKSLLALDAFFPECEDISITSLDLLWKPTGSLI